MESQKDFKFNRKNVFVLSIVIIVLLAIGSLYFFSDSFKSNDNNLITGNAINIPSENKVIAKVNGEDIYEKELNDSINSLQKQTQNKVNESIVTSGLINQVLLLQDAKDKGISVTDEDVEKSIEEQLSLRGGTLEEYKKQIETSGADYNAIFESYKEQMILQELSSLILEDYELNVSEEEKKEFYDKNSQEAISLGYNVTSYENISEQIEQVLLQRKQQEIIGEYIENLKSDAEIEIY